MGYRYSSLRTNLPREIMSYSDFPFIPEAMQGRSKDPRRFPHHTEVRLKVLPEQAISLRESGRTALNILRIPRSSLLTALVENLIIGSPPVFLALSEVDSLTVCMTQPQDGLPRTLVMPSSCDAVVHAVSCCC